MGAPLPPTGASFPLPLASCRHSNDTVMRVFILAHIATLTASLHQPFVPRKQRAADVITDAQFMDQLSDVHGLETWPSSTPQRRTLPTRYVANARDRAGVNHQINGVSQPSSQPKASTASLSPAIPTILTLDEFHAALEYARLLGRFAVFKFYSRRCRACLSIKPLYERLATGPLSDHVVFYEVEAEAARALCSLVGINKAPVVQLYVHGELHDTRPITNRALLSEFENGLALRLQGYSA